MHYNPNYGAPFHGEFSSADASALTEPNSRFTLYKPGTTTAVSIGSTDTIVVTDIVVVSEDALTVQVYDGADTTVGAGETIHAGEYPANGGVVWASATPHYCQTGTYPKIKTSGAGQVRATIRGRIIKAS